MAPLLAVCATFPLSKADIILLKRYEEALNVVCDKNQVWENRKQSFIQNPGLVKRVCLLYAANVRKESANIL